jgi:ParB family chromosome partitioning protein
MLDWKEIDAKILDIPERDAYRLALETNIKQKNLSPIEEAIHLSKMMKMFEWSQRKTASELGKSDIWIRDRLRLLDLNPEIQQMIVRGILAPSHGIELAKVPHKGLQMILANRIIKDNISTGEPTECMVKESLVLLNSAKKKEELRAIMELAGLLTAAELQEIVQQLKWGLYVDFAYRVQIIKELRAKEGTEFQLRFSHEDFETLIAAAKKTGKDLHMLMDEWFIAGLKMDGFLK